MSRASDILNKYTVITEKKVQGEDLYKALKQIVDDKSMDRVNGKMVDLTSANMAVQVLNKLNPENRKKLLDLSIDKLLNVVMKLVK